MEESTPNPLRFSLNQKLAILAEWHAGESLPIVACRHGVNRQTLASWAIRLKQRKKDNPDAVWASRPPPVRMTAKAKLARLIEKTGLDIGKPEEAAAACAGLAREALEEARGREVRTWKNAEFAYLREVAGQTAAKVQHSPVTNPGDAWAPHPAQQPPAGDWATWLFLGGRGAGKTRAGAEWLAAIAAESPGARLALIGPALHDVREVMVDRPSGLARLPGRERPRWESSRRRLVWSNGAAAYAFSAEDADGLRGPQHVAAWADEFCSWRKAGDTLAVLRMTLRDGERPRLCVTTTPRPIPALRRLMAEPGCEVTRAATTANGEHLSPAFIDTVRAQYGGTRWEAQELDGLVLDGLEGALWRAEDLARVRGPRPERFDTVVVGVDPPATATGDACGIVAAGRWEDRGFVLGDRTARGLSPAGWAGRVAATVAEFGAHRVVAEANQGGEMVRAVLAGSGVNCPVKLVHASQGKRTRAEPIAALYEQGRITHCGAFPQLEEEMMAVGAEDGGSGSPDRADALVWALTDLMLGPRRLGPRVVSFGWG